jgi:hypothetical protein
MKTVTAILLTVSLLASCDVRAQEEEAVGEHEYLFYKGRGFGSEVFVNPLSLIINGGYGILQYGNLKRDINGIHYATGFHNVIDNLSHPGASIGEYGWGEFFSNEIFPTSLNRKNAQYWPNYQNHLIGGGMHYVEMTEWYRWNNVPMPEVSAIATMAVYHFLNETVENNAYVGTNVDPVADLLIFDPLGILLFSIDGVPEFFAHKLRLSNWSLQPSWSPFTGTIENQGINYSIRVGLPFAEKFSLFYYWGLTGLLGASYSADGKDSWSVGAGLRAKELVSAVDDGAGPRKMTTTLTWNAGLFYDRDNSLLWSLIVSGVSDYSVHLNVYPGAVNIAGVSPGFFWALSDNGVMIAGITAAILPVGIAGRTTPR